MAAIVILLASLDAPSFAADKLSDVDISYWVRDSLRIDPRVDVAKINVTSGWGIVTLTGSVDNLAAKQYADLETKKINGVPGGHQLPRLYPVLRRRLLLLVG